MRFVRLFCLLLGTTDTSVQVANYADAIKIACDFMSVDNLKRTERVAGELRRQRLAVLYGDDVLAFYLTLWYTWEALSPRLHTMPAGVERDPPVFALPVDEPSPMDMDFDPSPMHVTAGDGLSSPASPAGDQDSPRFMATSIVSPVSGPSLQKSRRDKVYRKRQREKKRLVELCSPRAIFECSHPLCLGRKFTRPGFFDHM
jgi:hypothetical protein